jgi:hypothetical protein
MFTNIFDSSPENYVKVSSIQEDFKRTTGQNHSKQICECGAFWENSWRVDKRRQNRGRNKLSPKKSRLLIGVVQELKTKRPHLTPVPFPFQIFLSRMLTSPLIYRSAVLTAALMCLVLKHLAQ